MFDYQHFISVIMSRKLISAAHSLQLVPVYNIIHFGVVRSKVVIRSIGKPDILMIVPGTLKPGDSKNEDVYTKKHTFKLADVSQNKTLYLENLKATPFVALYTDETGNTRVSGSHDYPLTFSFEIGGGLYNCTLSGTGPGVDAFL